MKNIKLIATSLLSAGVMLSSAVAPTITAFAEEEQIVAMSQESIKINDCFIAAFPVEYTGGPLRTTVIIRTPDGVKLTENVDYTLEFGNRVLPGTSSVHITGIGDYTGECDFPFEIIKSTINFEFSCKRYDTYVELIPKTPDLDYSVYESNEKGEFENLEAYIKSGKTYKITGLTPSTVYYYKVYPMLDGVEVGNPIVLKLVTLPAMPKLISISSKTNDVAIRLAKDNSDPVRVYRWNGKYYEVIADNFSRIEFIDTNVKPGTKYYYRVTKLSQVDGKSYESAPFSTSVVTKPLGTEMIPDYTSTDSAIRVNWKKVTGVDGYVVSRYNKSLKKWENISTITNPDVLTYRDSGLNSATAYNYRVQTFVKVDGKMVYGEVSLAVMGYTKPKAVNLKTSYNTSQTSLRIKWDAIPGASGYEIYSGDTKVASVGNVSEYKITKLTPGKTYKYKVRAYKNAGDKVLRGSFSSTNSYTTVSADAKYKVKKNSAYYGTDKKKLGTLSGTFVGHISPKYQGYVVLSYDKKDVLVKIEDATKI